MTINFVQALNEKSFLNKNLSINKPIKVQLLFCFEIIKLMLQLKYTKYFYIIFFKKIFERLLM